MKIRAGSILLSLLVLAMPAAAEEGKLWLGSQNKTPAVELNLPSFAPVIEKLGGAVVNVSSEGTEEVSEAPKTFRFQGPGGNAPQSPFDFFFQIPPGGQNERSFASLGSGFVIHPDGYIVTNNHVVDRATKILVTFRDDKTEYQAKVIGRDRKTDIALLKVDTKRPLEATVLGDSDTVRTGDWVIAIGNPFRLGHTATVGIVSAKSRKVPGGGPYDDFIQTDASINPGNSGGPLFNARGEVIGINTAIYSPGRMGGGGFNIGIGFATPINIVKSIITELHDKGKVTRGWLGVLIQPVSPDMATALGLEKAEGALVADVLPKSPADKAGLARGDVIVKYDGKLVTENDDLPRMVGDTEIGSKVEVEYVRHNDRKTLSVTIEELTEDAEEEAAPVPEENKTGLFVQDLTPDVARSLGIDDEQGALVTQVAPGSPAEDAGLQRGDVILEIGGQAISNVKDFNRLVEKLKPGKPALLLVRREKNTVFLTLKLQ